MLDHDPACEVAHGDARVASDPDRHLVAVYATPVAATMLHWARELGFRTTLLEPDASRVDGDLRALSDEVHTAPQDVEVAAVTDVVVTDHHREDLGPVMAPLLTAEPRWIGIMGSPRHTGPHEAALAAEGVPDGLIATVHRPIGLDIGSKTPPEIALSTLAGLLADRSGRSGGFPTVRPKG